MTKKDFELIAKSIKILTQYGLSHGERYTVATTFADNLGSTNERFDRNRFIKACIE